MSDEKNLKNIKAAAEASVAKLTAIREARKLQDPDSQWTVIQEIFQDIHAGYIVTNPEGRHTVPTMAKDLIKEIETRYKDDEETKNLLLSAVPQHRSIREWMKKDGWEEAVWNRIRGDQLFSPEKRAQVIESLRIRAMTRSDTAAKLWLTMSGDYQEKMEINDATVDTYREINKVLHKKKEN